MHVYTHSRLEKLRMDIYVYMVFAHMRGMYTSDRAVQPHTCAEERLKGF